jgi:enoyl-[acyl-carrier protein] reductase I
MRERVAPLIEGNSSFKLFECDFMIDEQVAQLTKDVEATYGKIDFLVHSAAYANKEDLMGDFIKTSEEGFATALTVSAYSLVKLCRALEPVMNDGGSVMTLSYLGSTRAVGNYNVMGVAKAALEAEVRYLSFDMGKRGIRVNTLSPGPINTVAARGVRGLLEMIEYVHERAPLKGAEFGAKEVGGSAVYLMSDLSKGVTGQIIYIDNGYNIVGV